jgi:hypothetical protein
MTADERILRVRSCIEMGLIETAAYHLLSLDAFDPRVSDKEVDRLWRDIGRLREDHVAAQKALLSAAAEELPAGKVKIRGTNKPFATITALPRTAQVSDE